MTASSRLAYQAATLSALLLVWAAAPAPGQAQENEAPALSCTNPELNIPIGAYPGPMVVHPGNAVEPSTGKTFFLDYPCDLEPGAEVTFIMNIHGGGSIGNWQRHYFPAFDFKDRYNLIVASPAAGDPAANGSWSLERDREFLDAVFHYVYDHFADYEIKAFWLVGHSQGGAVSRQLVCSEPYRDRITGFVSLTGGRVGSPGGAQATLPDCDFSHIFSAGEHENAGMNLSATSLWAEHLGCSARERQRPNLVDVQPGYVYDSREANLTNMRLSWGRFPRPGTTEWYVYPDCQNGRVVADLIRIDKGHTEGLEPAVTERIIQLMLSATE